MADGLRLSQVSRLEEVDRSAWHRLVAGDGFYLSYQWLLGQQDPNIPVAYMLAHDGEALVGALPLYRFRRSRAAESIDIHRGTSSRYESLDGCP